MAFWQGSDVTTREALPGTEGGPVDVLQPKRVRQAFSGQFSRAFCPNRDQFGQKARENWPALGGPVDCPPPSGRGSFLTQGFSRVPGKSAEMTRPTRGPGTRERSRSSVEGRVAAGRSHPAFWAAGLSKDAADLVEGTEVSLAPRPVRNT